jgi:hypothetical protein
MHQLGLRERQASVPIDQEVAVGRRDMNGSRPNLVTLGRLQDLEMGPPPKNLGHQAPVARIEMLDNDNRRGKTGGETLQDVPDRRDATRGGGQGDHVERRSRKPLGGFRRVEIVRLS